MICKACVPASVGRPLAIPDVASSRMAWEGGCFLVRPQPHDNSAKLIDVFLVAVCVAAQRLRSSLSLLLCQAKAEAAVLIIIDELNSGLFERPLNFEQS